MEDMIILHSRHSLEETLFIRLGIRLVSERNQVFPILMTLTKLRHLLGGRCTRQYLRNKHTSSWKYMARLAATKEYAFLKVLHENGYPVPRPIDQNRHCIVMGLVDAYPLYQIQELEDPGALYSQLMNLIVRLATAGLIHGDFNEFNLLVNSDNQPILIDFPQMVSTRHRNAEMYFNRDVDCIREFFRKRFQYVSKLYPKFTRDVDQKEEFRLDVQVAASGFTLKDQSELERVCLF